MRCFEMKEYNSFQKKFMKSLANIQDFCVQNALCQKWQCVEDMLYDVTADVIIAILENIDEYGDMEKFDVVCCDTKETLKQNPHIELHDVICEYIKGV